MSRTTDSGAMRILPAALRIVNRYYARRGGHFTGAWRAPRV